MKSPSLSSLALLAAVAVPAACQALPTPYTVALAGATNAEYGDVVAVRGRNVAGLLADGATPKPRKAGDHAEFAFMRLWDGTATLNGMLGGTATIQLARTLGQPQPQDLLALELDDISPDEWTLFAQDGAFAAESLQFGYGTWQVVATGRGKGDGGNTL